MAIPAQIPNLVPLARTAIALDALALRPGQSVEARVLGQLPGGATRLAIGNQVVEAALPGRPQPGAILQLQVQGSGTSARLAVVAQPQVTAGNSANPAGARPAPVVALPLGVPGAVQQAVAQSAQVSAARQDGIGALFATLAGLGGRLAALPEPVGQAAFQLLAARLNAGGRPLDGAALKQAVARSGLFFELGLQKGASPAAQAADMKGALLSLRNALSQWLGADAGTGAQGARRTPPPTRGATPRAEPPVRLPDAQAAQPREAGKVLLAQTEAALSRVRLSQIASLPESGARNATTQLATDWTLELPLVLGGELSMAQFRISRDGGSGAKPEERGWTMQFAINFSIIGEVGAHVALRGGRAGVMLWAERAETAAALEALLPELSDSLAAKGLEPGVVRVRHGVPGAPRNPPGVFVDAGT